jgi:hypothetical protein
MILTRFIVTTGKVGITGCARFGVKRVNRGKAIQYCRVLNNFYLPNCGHVLESPLLNYRS